MTLWNDLLQFAKKGEQLIETEAAHVAVLTARMMHADRLKAEATPVEPAPVAESASVVEAPAAEVSSGS